MKKILVLFNLLIISQLTFAQSILAGSETFDKVRKEGFYVILNIDDKYVSKDWAAYISKFGSVQNKRDDYTINSANMQSVSPDPVLFSSKITGAKNKTTVFAAFDLGAGNMVAQNSKGYDGVQKVFQDFYAFAMANQDVRLADDDMNASQATLDKMVKTGDKLNRNIESNKKDKEKLLKKLDDNKLELEQLMKDQTANLQDQVNGRVMLEEKKKALETVKAKVPKL